ncbi:hypothetical protein CaCOL14_007172 [Colletotrichum acutatum]|uniref:Uncharacterized protein n=1 Tax=Glomerella acutata TaxID=27357 RepID=A0AAD8UGW7_GLOAC|nr:uncharacterized protein BDZ83DRAFT_625775 [Colletotrichum acutatum]KAK1723681.1 hypothetical protein BDZ83DRAFT_625775 [Colletotrichum acutatum]
MDIDEDDDFYADEPSTEQPTTSTTTAENAAPPPQEASPKVEAPESKSEELEEGEEEDEGGAMDEDEDDSDIDIITERKDGTKAAPPTQSRYSDIRNIPQRSASNDMAIKAAPVKEEDSARASPSDLPLGVPSADKAAAAASKSTIDVNANPDYPPVGKPITAVNIDEGKNGHAHLLRCRIANTLCRLDREREALAQTRYRYQRLLQLRLRRVHVGTLRRQAGSRSRRV